jgi:hypothetical protein
MCTVSWAVARGGYDLFFNRDELHSRAPEEPATLTWRDGVAYLAPRDGAHGGTWLLANEFGTTVCLLNDYGVAWRPAASSPRFSRGHVAAACAAAASLDEVLAAVRTQPLTATPAFRLVALRPDEEPLVLHWQGARLVRCHAATAVPPLSSSSFATAEVIAQRTWRFASFVRRPERPQAEELAAYHRQHEPAAGAHSVLMRRPDAATRSIMHVAVDAQRVQLHYQPVQWTPGGPSMPAQTRVALGRRARATLAA